MQRLRWTQRAVSSPDQTLEELGLGASAPGRRRLVTLDLENVAAVTVDLHRAGLRCGRVRITSDRTSKVRLVLADGSVRRVGVRTGARTARIAC